MKHLANHRRPWKVADTRALEFGWGLKHVDVIARELGRTPAAVRKRAEEIGLGGAGRGTHSPCFEYFPRPLKIRSPSGGTGRKPAACNGCGTTARPHRGRGHCSACYQRKARGTLAGPGLASAGVSSARKAAA